VITRLISERWIIHAKVAELADAPDLGSGGETHGGSSPPFRTNLTASLPGRTIFPAIEISVEAGRNEDNMRKPSKKTKKKHTKLKKTAARRARLVEKKVTKKLAKRKAAPKKKSALKKAAVKTKAIRKKTEGVNAAGVLRIPSRPAGESGDLQGLSNVEAANSESVRELVEEGNAFEADVVAGVEDAGSHQEREVRTHEVPEDDVPGEYLDKD
jgi:hypothetical protein